jgi:uncharacterized protein (PEP-CTERM system associated)
LALAPPQWAAAAPPRPRRGRARRIALLAVAACGLAAIARAQDAPEGGGGTAAAPGGGAAGGGAGGAPAGGVATPAPAAPDAAPGSLRAQIESVLPGVNAPPAGPTTQPAWIITPGLTVQEQWTDNTFQTPTDHKPSLLSIVSPSLSINGSTARLQADLYYAPNLEFYEPEATQNQVGQNFGGDALLTLAPEQFYIKATGFAGLQSIAGATTTTTGPGGTVAQPTANELQTYNFSVEPYFTQRFGGWGALQVGALASEFTTGAVNGGAAVQSLTSRQEFATFKSGENFGRLLSTVQVSSTQNTGTGALQGSSQQLASYQAGYAITRDFIALASIGWEDIRYTGIGAPRYDDATWSVGAQLTPNPDSSIVVSYGHQQGATAASVNASYAPTARIRLFAQYSDGVTTAAQSVSNALSGATFDAQGHPINPITDQPLSPYSNFFGFNGGVYEAKNLLLSASLLWPRDGFQVSLQKQTQTPVGTAGATTLLAIDGNLAFNAGLGPTSGTYGSFSWEHDISPVLNSNLFAQYGVLHNAIPLTLTNGVLTVNVGQQVQDATQLTLSGTLNWQINRTLTGSLQYSYSSTGYSGGLPGVAVNLVVLGLHKTF